MADFDPFAILDPTRMERQIVAATTGASARGSNIEYAANGGFVGAVSFADDPFVTQINLATYSEIKGLNPALTNEGITSVDVSGCSALMSLDVSGDIGITSLDLSGSGLSAAPTGYTGLSSLASLDISNMSNVTSFTTSLASLVSITTANTPLTSLTITSAALTAINLLSNKELTSLSIAASGLSSVDVSANVLLTMLRITSSAITSVNVTQNTGLTTLSVDAPLNTLDLSHNTALDTLFIGDSNLTTLSIAQTIGWVSVEVQLNSLLTTITPPVSLPSVNDFQVNGNALIQANVNALLVLLADNAISNGLADFSGGTNAAPSGAGAAAVITLTGRGWTVNTN